MFPSIEFVIQKTRNVSISYFDNWQGSEYVSGFIFPQNLSTPSIGRNLDPSFATLLRYLPILKPAIWTS